jgi:hypothetical protein
MKIRIEDNSVRLRLRRSEVDHLAKGGSLKSSTVLSNGLFEYAIESSTEISDLTAGFSAGCITIRVPEAWIKEWPDSSKVGFETRKLFNGAELHLLVEKDFVCLDRNLEDQEDQYPHPKQGTL